MGLQVVLIVISSLAARPTQLVAECMCEAAGAIYVHRLAALEVVKLHYMNHTEIHRQDS